MSITISHEFAKRLFHGACRVIQCAQNYAEQRGDTVAFP